MDTAASNPIKPWSAEFVDPTLERSYRVETFPAARRQNRIACILVALLVLGHTISDYAAVGGTTLYFVFLAVRLAAAGLMLLLFPFSSTPRHYRLSDWGVFVGQVTLAAAFVYIPTAMPGEVMQARISVDSMTSILVVLGLYLFVQTRLFLHVIAGVGTSAAYIAASVATDRLAVEPAMLEAVMHLTCNIFGFVALNRINRVRRQRFATVRAYQDANRQLLNQRRELKILARNLEQARDEAVYANRAKSEFLAHMSHELRSPLNAIIGFSEVMTEQMFGRMEPPRYRDYAVDIHASGTHLLALINDLLDLSKAEAGRMELHEEPVDLREVSRSVQRLVIERARKSNLTVETDVADGLPLLRADQRLVKQMTLNLMTNAIKFTEAGGTITLTADRGRNGGLRLRVRDTGIGIAPDDIPRILEPYGQVQREGDAAETEGTGLGLPLVKQMIEMHGGRLAIQSEPGHGSTFTLTFPPARTLAEDAGGAAATAA